MPGRILRVPLLRKVAEAWPWWLLLLALVGVRLSKGAGFMDAYALLSRPFWPGSAQSEWLRSAQHLQDQASLQQLQRDNERLRGLLALENQGAAQFFGEPMLNIADLMQVEGGKGVVNILAADKLMRSPKLYATFLLWLLSELFESLPEVGDPEKPKLVFFFDEAHLLFDDAPKALQDTIEQVVRLIRSKGVGVFFVTQNPIDIPEEVAGQLGNRVQHALRAFTPRDQRAIKAAAEATR